MIKMEPGCHLQWEPLAQQKGDKPKNLQLCPASTVVGLLQSPTKLCVSFWSLDAGHLNSVMVDLKKTPPTEGNANRLERMWVYVAHMPLSNLMLPTCSSCWGFKEPLSVVPTLTGRLASLPGRDHRVGDAECGPYSHWQVGTPPRQRPSFGWCCGWSTVWGRRTHPLRNNF